MWLVAIGHEIYSACIIRACSGMYNHDVLHETSRSWYGGEKAM